LHTATTLPRTTSMPRPAEEPPVPAPPGFAVAEQHARRGAADAPVSVERYP
jgi:hypothetical protein